MERISDTDRSVNAIVFLKIYKVSLSAEVLCSIRENDSRRLSFLSISCYTGGPRKQHFHRDYTTPGGAVAIAMYDDHLGIRSAILTLIRIAEFQT